jgi:hypothetical protein
MIALIDYGAGNVRSVHKALDAVGGGASPPDEAPAGGRGASPSDEAPAAGGGASPLTQGCGGSIE